MILRAFINNEQQCDYDMLFAKSVNLSGYVTSYHIKQH